MKLPSYDRGDGSNAVDFCESGHNRPMEPPAFNPATPTKVPTKWIQKAISKPGSLRATAKRKGLLKGDEKLSASDLASLEKSGGKTAKRARLAKTLKAMHQ